MLGTLERQRQEREEAAREHAEANPLGLYYLINSQHDTACYVAESAGEAENMARDDDFIRVSTTATKMLTDQELLEENLRLIAKGGFFISRTNICGPDCWQEILQLCENYSSSQTWSERLKGRLESKQSYHMGEWIRTYTVAGFPLVELDPRYQRLQQIEQHVKGLKHLLA